MSLYQMVNGVNPAAFFILPLLDRHPDEYPRFRDCFVKDGKIQVYTRTGGANRSSYEEENQSMCEMPTYMCTYDYDKDSTYAYWEFKVPEQWQADFDKVVAGQMLTVSIAYVKQLIKVYPKLEEKFRLTFAEVLNAGG